MTVSVLENLMLYYISEDPSSQMYIFPTDETLRMRMKLAFEPALDSSDVRRFIKPGSIDKKGRRSGDTILFKEYPGGFFMASSFENKGKFRSFSVKRLFFDELDSAPQILKNEGDPITNFLSRTQAWGAQKKIYYISTPVTLDDSRIWKLYKEGDQRRYYIPCIKCNHFHFFDLENFRYETNSRGVVLPDSVYFECPKCKYKIKEHHKKIIMESGEWRATEESKSKNLVSYHISSFYAPTQFDSWFLIAEKYERALAEERDSGDTSQLENFYKLQLGIPWMRKEEETINPQLLYNSTRITGSYKSGNKNLPDEILFLTAGSDVQSDRIEVEIVGWARNAVSYAVDYQVIKLANFKDQFLALVDYLSMPRTTISGRELIMSAAFIDSGFQTEDIYEACTEAFGIYPCMGFSDTRKNRQLIVQTKLRTSGGVRYDLNVDTLKDRFFKNLAKVNKIDGTYPSGYCAFPSDYDEKYYRQLVSEKKIKKKNRTGRLVEQWVQMRKRNESLDCRIYAMGAFYFVLSKICLESLKLSQITYEPFWNFAEQQAGIINTPED